MSGTLKSPKIAECLDILNNRQLGVLNRLHFMKCTLSDPSTRPAFMPGGDKSYENAWKVMLKKFPNVDARSNVSTLNVFLSKNDLPKLMSSFYYNIVDVLEVKDYVLELLNRITYCAFKLDITINSDLTRLYLELVTNYFAMMYFLTRIPDLKAILILFNYLYEQANGKLEPNFSRMSERFVESPEQMLKHLHGELLPHSIVLSGALASLGNFFSRRLVRAQNWRDSVFLNLFAEPKKIALTALSDQLTCELLPYEMMERWMVFGYLLTDPNLLENDEAFNRLRPALRNSFVVVLFRDEVINVHSLLTTFFETVWTSKTASKRLSDIKETMSIAYSQAPGAHADRRVYLRQALRQLHCILADQPGLLGPKAFIVFWGLSYATDEVHWLLRHSSNVPLKKNVNTEDLVDHGLSELLFYMEDLRNLVKKYASVIQRFHIQMLRSYDAPGLEEYLRPVLSRLPMTEIDMFNSMLTQLAEAEERGDSVKAYEFSGLRLDWLRLQVTLSAKDSSLVLSDCRRLAEHLHSTIFHSRLIDQLDDLLRQVSDLSIFFFYRNKFEELFDSSLTYPSQLRYTGVFPTICTSFTQASHKMCPKEHFLIGRLSSGLAKKFYQKLVESICNAFFTRMEQACELAKQLSPSNAVSWLHEDRGSGKKREVTQHTGKPESNGYIPPMEQAPIQKWSRSTSLGKGGAQINPQKPAPGGESLRRDRVLQTKFDKTLFSLSQLCAALTYRTELHCFDELFDPRMFLQLELQARLYERISASVYVMPPEGIHNDKSQPVEPKRIRKPSDMLRRMQAVMDTIIELEDFVRIDVVAMFSNIFGQHTQPVGANLPNDCTSLAAQYTQWYVDCFIQQAYLGHFVYSPQLKAFVTLLSHPVDSLHFRAEEYGDLNELRALAELISPLGISSICEQLTEQIGARMDKVKQLVLNNRSELEKLRGSFDDPVKTRQLAAGLQQPDELLSYLTEIGVALAFQSLCREATGDVLQRRAPFLVATSRIIKTFMQSKAHGKLLPPLPAAQDFEAVRRLFELQLITANLCSAMGINCELDAGLCLDLRARRQSMLTGSSSGTSPSSQIDGVRDSLNRDYHIACLFIVFVANALPQLARTEGCAYHINLAANEGNIHCIAQAVTTIMIVLFSVLSPGDLEERSTEFLALASSNLLRLGLETSSSLVSAEISGVGVAGAADGEGRKAASVSASSSSQRDSVYLLFDQIVRKAPFLTANLQEACFPYALIRSAFHQVASSMEPRRLQQHNHHPGQQQRAQNY